MQRNTVYITLSSPVHDVLTSVAYISQLPSPSPVISECRKMASMTPWPAIPIIWDKVSQSSDTAPPSYSTCEEEGCQRMEPCGGWTWITVLHQGSLFPSPLSSTGVYNTGQHGWTTGPHQSNWLLLRSSGLISAPLCFWTGRVWGSPKKDKKTWIMSSHVKTITMGEINYYK